MRRTKKLPMSEINLTVGSNIYEAGVLHTNGEIYVEGITYGIVDGKPVDGDRKVTHSLSKAWIDEMGLGLLDSQGNRYVVIDYDEMHQFMTKNLYLLFGLAYLEGGSA